MNKVRIAILVCVLWAGVSSGLAADLADWVDPLVGTRNMGHTYPGATVPFGMVQLSPDTRHLNMYDDAGKYVGEAYRYCSGYQYDDDTIAGFSHTHFSGTGHSDLGDISLMPTTGGTPFLADADFSSHFSHHTETAEPGYYKVTLEDPKIDVELTATTKVGMHRYTFGTESPGRVVLDMTANIYNYDGKNVWTFLRVENDTLVTGYRQTTGWARTRTVYFAMSFSQPITAYGHKKLDTTPYGGFYRRFDQENNFPEMAGREILAHFDFDVEKDDQLLVKVALSPTSTAGALKNLAAELPHWNFDEVRSQARQGWNRELGKIEVETMTEDQRSVFYTALYHTMLGPVVYEDVDGSYRGLDQNIHQSEGFTNYTVFSLWDTYRALHPLFNLIQTQRNTDMIKSMLAHFDQSVHPMLPVWSHYANENWCMIGYHAVPVIADAVVKGNRDIDLRRALAACVATSNVPYFDGIEEYRQLGYVPDEVSGSSVSMTLEMAYDDWCIARMAELTGGEELALEYRKRAGSWRHVFDSETGFMRPRQRDGFWRQDFNTMATHGQGFIEGNAWNYSLYVPQDVPGLVEAMGGATKMGRHLDELFTMELSDEHIAHTEDITRDGIIGNYVHGNEPGHHIAYLYNWTDRPWQTQARVRHIMDTMYGPGVDGLCGNDDAGQMSAWYIFSALGFYPVCPGSSDYALGSPLVKRAVINLENGKTLTIRAENQSPANVFVQRVEVNGKVIDRRHLNHKELARGGEVVFHMSPRPAHQVDGLARDNELADEAREAFLHAWNNYQEYAWAMDALRPLSQTGHNWYDVSLYMTPVDAYDTMLIMGLHEEARRAKELVLANLRFDHDMLVQVFEIDIRLLGGMISAYQLDHDKRWLELATDLADRLMPAFDSPTGMPYVRVNLVTGETEQPTNNPAEIGTLTLEFEQLSRLTGDPKYGAAAKKAVTELFNRRSELGLVGEIINVETGEWVHPASHIGGMIDSYYEYLLKAWLLFGDEDYKQMWEASRDAINLHLADEPEGKGLWYGIVDMNTGQMTDTTFGALQAFLPAVLALGGDLDRGGRLMESVYSMWTRFTVEPEVFNYETGEILYGGYPLRPEAIESAYYMFVLTGQEKYRDMGRDIFHRIMANTRVATGFTHLNDVRTMEKADAMESFFLAETLKYAYLLGLPEAVDFEGVIFNTEAHPQVPVR